MNPTDMQAALADLDRRLAKKAPTGPIKLLIGGGAAMLLLYHFPMATSDIDGVVFQSPLSQADINPFVYEIASERNLPRDWLNPYFGAFLYALPKDYGKRLLPIYDGPYLKAYGLGKEDLLILKCMAGRGKDRGHALALLKAGANADFVETHLHSLLEKGIPRTQEAIDFFDALLDSLENPA